MPAIQSAMRSDQHDDFAFPAAPCAFPVPTAVRFGRCAGFADRHDFLDQATTFCRSAWCPMKGSMMPENSGSRGPYSRHAQQSQAGRARALSARGLETASSSGSGVPPLVVVVACGREPCDNARRMLVDTDVSHAVSVRAIGSTCLRPVRRGTHENV